MSIARVVGFFTVLLAVSLALPLAGYAHTGHVSEPERHVIIDTDMGLDDVRAVFALLADSTLGIEAIVTVGGSSATGRGTDNLVGLLEASRSSSVPVIRGIEGAGLGSPPWRQTANTMGGASFPPPRKTVVVDFTADVMADIIEHSPGVQYVALGPLGNLRALAVADPETFRRIDTIFIPAVVRSGSMSDWNLVYDGEASHVVFDSATSVVIIDISAAREIDGAAFLSSLEGDSYPLRYIGRLLSGMSGDTGHIFIYDELAAAAFLRPDLVEVDDQAYEVRMESSGVFSLTPAPEGNVRVARLVSRDDALDVLSDLYGRGPADRHANGHTYEVPAEALLRTFHGHLGPYVVIGYRMGRLALSELGSEGHFGISAEVHSPRETPGSCLIDGVQIGSGCTLGKGNIVVKEAPEPAWAAFRTAGGDRVAIRLQPGIPALIRDLVDADGVEAAGRMFFEMRLDSLFAVDRAAR